MGRAERKKKEERKRLRNKGYDECGNCGKPINPRVARCPQCGKWSSAGRRALAVSTVLIISACLVGAYLMFPIGEQAAYVDTDGNPDDIVTPTFLHAIGTGEEDFWSSAVSHPSWVVSAVQTRPQLILTHSTGCAPCDTMISICEPLSAEYSGQIDYYDITSGTDEPEATDCFDAYDTADPHYVPLTTIVTTGPDGTIIWHSWEGVIEEATLIGWIEDAISYHEESR